MVDNKDASPVGNLHKRKDNMADDKEKKLFLTKLEQENIKSRHDLIKQYQYLIHVVNADIAAYMNYEVLKRLSVPEGTKVSLSPDNSYIIVMEDKNDTTATKH